MSKKLASHGPDLTEHAYETEAPASELARLRQVLEATEKRIFELEHPVIEFPKMVRGRTFASQAELDAAGPEFSESPVEAQGV